MQPRADVYRSRLRPQPIAKAAVINADIYHRGYGGTQRLAAVSGQSSTVSYVCDWLTSATRSLHTFLEDLAEGFVIEA